MVFTIAAITQNQYPIPIIQIGIITQGLQSVMFSGTYTVLNPNSILKRVFLFVHLPLIEIHGIPLTNRFEEAA